MAPSHPFSRRQQIMNWELMFVKPSIVYKECLQSIVLLYLSSQEAGKAGHTVPIFQQGSLRLRMGKQGSGAPVLVRAELAARGGEASKTPLDICMRSAQRGVSSSCPEENPPD